MFQGHVSSDTETQIKTHTLTRVFPRTVCIPKPLWCSVFLQHHEKGSTIGIILIFISWRKCLRYFCLEMNNGWYPNVWLHSPGGRKKAFYRDKERNYFYENSVFPEKNIRLKIHFFQFFSCQRVLGGFVVFVWWFVLV